jgi:hypothetical protein
MMPHHEGQILVPPPGDFWDSDFSVNSAQQFSFLKRDKIS